MKMPSNRELCRLEHPRYKQSVPTVLSREPLLRNVRSNASLDWYAANSQYKARQGKQATIFTLARSHPSFLLCLDI